MNKPTTKLIVRTQLPLVDTSERVVPPDEVVYLWDRIIGAILVLLLIVAAAGFGIRQWLQKPQPNPVTTTEALMADSAPSTASITTPAPANPSLYPREAKDNALTAAARTSPDRPSKIITTANNNASPSTAEGLAPTQIFSDHVLRAQLSRGLQQKEPIHPAAAIIPMTAQGLIKVYFFTEIKNLKGQPLYFDWYRGDQRLARVTSHPDSDQAPIYSSKYIDRKMLGQWRVELSTTTGTRLAQAQFEVRSNK